MGNDNLATLHKWKNYDEILKQYEIIVYPRKGTELKKFKEAKGIIFVDAPMMEITSTGIRQMIKEKKDVRFMMPQGAWEYCKEMHFYEK